MSPEKPKNPSKLDQTRFWFLVAFALALLAGEIYLYTQNFFMPNTVKKSDLSAPLATVKSIENEVVRKSHGTLIWQNSQVGADLFREDAIATMNDAETVITFADQSELVIEPNSLVILEMAPEMEKQALPGKSKIMLRLIKGSIKRKNKGASKLLVKLSSDPNAKVADLDDPAGGAVFRLVRYEWGLQVVIEGGKVSVDNGKTMGEGETADIVHDAKKLPPPWLKKPSVEIKRNEESSNRTPCWLGFLIPCAYAADEAPLEVTIHFQWKEVENANAYLIQVSRDSSFSQIILEKKLSDTGYDYTFPSDYSSNEFYFRVAAVSVKNELGKFSDPQRVEVKAGAFRPKPVKVKKKPPPPVVKKVEVAAPEEEAAAPPKPKSRSRTEVALGAMYHQRDFKSKTEKPLTAHGGGFVPAEIRLEQTWLADDDHVSLFGGAYLFETARPNVGSSDGDEEQKKIGTPLWRVWFLRGSSGKPTMFSWGPYATSTSVIKESGVEFTGQTKILLGVLARYSLHPGGETGSEWSIESGVLAVGSLGVDLRASIQRPFSVGDTGSYRPIEKTGYFWRIEAMLRQIKIESSYGATLEIGRWF